MRRFHQSASVVLGYDETAFPGEVVRAAREAWRALFPAQTMRFLRQDPHAPASVLLSLGSFRDTAQLHSTLDLLRSDAAKPARQALCELFRACTKPSPEFQFRYDVAGVMVRGRFVPSDPAEVGTALRGLWDLADGLRQAGLPHGASVVVAAYARGGWRLQAAHGFDPGSGAARRYRYQDGGWQAEVR